jgi:hypothetical protein
MYGMRIALDAEEMKTLQAVVEHDLNVCREEIRKGTTEPFLDRSRALRRFLAIQRAILKVSDRLSVDENQIYLLQTAFKNYLALDQQRVVGGAHSVFVTDRSKVEQLLARLWDEYYRAVEEADIWWESRERSLRNRPA